MLTRRELNQILAAINGMGEYINGYRRFRVSEIEELIKTFGPDNPPDPQTDSEDCWGSEQPTNTAKAVAKTLGKG